MRPLEMTDSMTGVAQQCVGVCWSVLLCVAVCCRVWQCVSHKTLPDSALSAGVL